MARKNNKEREAGTGMSFEWLNIPGLNTSDTTGDSGSSVSQPPPTVSFNFDGPTVSHIQQPSSALHYPSQDLESSKNSMTNGFNGWSSSQQLPQRDGVQYQNGQRPQQYPQHQNHPYQQSQYPQNYSLNYLQRPQQQQYMQQQSHYSSRPHYGGTHEQTGQLIQDNYRESQEDLRVPLSLSRSQLTKEEIQTYLRWYNYITARTHVKLVRLGDVFKFLSNFRLSEELKIRVTAIFRTCKNALNIGQFFAVLRLISKSLLENIMPERKMILEKAPIPRPPSILCTSAKEETYEEVEEDNGDGGDKVDFDSFASMLLTGSKPGKKRLRRKVVNSMHRNKKVRFSEKVTFQDPPTETENIPNGAASADDEDDVIDFSLPMDQLLKRMAKKKERSSALVSHLPSEQHETEEEKEVLEDMKDSLSHFKQIQTPDMPGVSEQMASGTFSNGSIVNGSGDGSNEKQSQQVPLQPLKPTSTGSANYLFKSAFTPAAPQGNSSENYGGDNNANEVDLQPLKPTATGSANYLVRSQYDAQTQPQQQQPQQQPQPGGLQPLKPTATGSANYLMKSQSEQQPMSDIQPRPSPNPIVSPAISQEEISSPPSKNQYMNFNQPPQNQQPLQYQQSLLQQQTSPSNQYQQPSLQSQSSPQPPNPNLLAAPNPAQNYFQSLLSPSPSPNQPNLNVPNGNNNLSIPNLNQSPSPYTHSPNLSSQQGPTQPPMVYNNGYPYPSSMPQQPSQQQSRYYTPPQQRMQYPQNYASNLSPMPGQNPYSMPVSAQSYNNRGNILGDLNSLQQQVDALQNVYGRR